MEFLANVGVPGREKGKSGHQQINEWLDLIQSVSNSSVYTHISVPQHWIGNDDVWMQPMPLLALAAPYSGHLKLATGIIQMPLYNPVQIAEEVATIDHISNGRFELGIGNGYREEELAAAGTNRRERAPRVEEAIEIMTRLWAGEELDFNGRFWTVHGKMALTPIQKPRPAINIAVHAEGAARRAARIGDGALMAPQIYWPELKQLCDAYEDECAKVGRRGTLAVPRRLGVVRNPQETAAAMEGLRASAAHSVGMYGAYNMQEKGMVDIHLDSQANDPMEYAIVGSPEECVEQIMRRKEELHFTRFSGQLVNMPDDQSGRKEFLQFVAEEVLSKIK